MAEQSSVENLGIPRFYCHKCNNEINRVSSDFTCPNCHNGFIEMLEPAYEEPEPDDDDTDTDLDPSYSNRIVPSMIEEDLSRPMRQLYPRSRRAPSHAGTSNGSWANRHRRHRNSRVRRPRPNLPSNNWPLDALLQEFIVNLSEFGGWANVDGGRGTNGPVFFLGNPGDYAWGREGLDAIVTQLLNQMDVSGPPPLSTDKIQEIPTVGVTQAQVDSSLQCSVCWEDFKLDELVRKLACGHVYHEHCIVPWLELHGTCPICRKTLNEDGTLGDPATVNADVNSLEAFLRAANRSASNISSSASTSSSSLGPDAYMNMEFDYD